MIATYSKAISTDVIPCDVCGKTVGTLTQEEIVIQRKHGKEIHETRIKLTK